MVKQPELAFWLERPSVAACEIARLVGYQAVIVDMEHGAIGEEACESIIAICRALGLRCIIRVAASERPRIQQALDYGADGVMLPQVRDIQHAREACAYAKYSPIGTRGIGYSRTMNYGVSTSIDDDFFAAENQRVTCHPMIETSGALRDVEAIASLATVDGVFIGPSDLSMARGRGSFQFTAGDKADFRTVAAAARKHGKVLGLPAPGVEVFALAVAEGASYVTVSDDITALRVGLEKGLEIARSREQRG